jgi:hypothetical protein
MFRGTGSPAFAGDDIRGRGAPAFNASRPIQISNSQSQIHVRVLAARRARGLHELFPLKTEGAGNAGCPLHPQPRVRSGWCTRVYSPQVHRNTRRFPRNGFNGLFRALPGDRAFLPPSFADQSANLTPASGRQDHTALPSAVAPFVRALMRAWCRCVHRIPPRVRDDRDTPL